MRSDIGIIVRPITNSTYAPLHDPTYATQFSTILSIIIVAFNT